jgi:uncharacterized protein YodC (DUF2158 family)
MQAQGIEDRANHVRELFLAAADEVYRQYGIRVKTQVDFPQAKPEDFVDTEFQLTDGQHYDTKCRQPKFNIGDVVTLNSGGVAMNVSNVNVTSPVVECLWTDEIGRFYCEIVPESCIRLYQEGSN